MKELTSRGDDERLARCSAELTQQIAAHLFVDRPPIRRQPELGRLEYLGGQRNTLLHCTFEKELDRSERISDSKCYVDPVSLAAG